jgi:hypothetical protein
VQETFWGAPGPISRNRQGGKLAIHIQGAILCNKVAGHFDQAAADRIMGHGDELAAQYGTLIVFSDWLLMASYDISCRTTMTRWGADLGRRLENFHVIAGSRLVKMGLAVASIVVAPLRVHPSMVTFMAAYQRADSTGVRRSTHPASERR